MSKHYTTVFNKTEKLDNRHKDILSSISIYNGSQIQELAMMSQHIWESQAFKSLPNWAKTSTSKGIDVRNQERMRYWRMTGEMIFAYWFPQLGWVEAKQLKDDTLYSAQWHPSAFVWTKTGRAYHGGYEISGRSEEGLLNMFAMQDSNRKITHPTRRQLSQWLSEYPGWNAVRDIEGIEGVILQGNTMTADDGVVGVRVRRVGDEIIVDLYGG